MRQMFKTPCSNEAVFWLTAINLSPLDSVICKSCVKQYHDQAKQKLRWIMYAILISVLVMMALSILLQSKELFNSVCLLMIKLQLDSFSCQL
jgi:predicted nucleic acid-binding Zn ribbon protein